MNHNILAIVFLMAGISLATTAVTTMVSAAYAGGDHDGGDGNKVKAEDDSIAQLLDCDNNEVEGELFPTVCEAFAGEP
jgi:hypothetical protein